MRPAVKICLVIGAFIAVCAAGIFWRLHQVAARKPEAVEAAPPVKNQMAAARSRLASKPTPSPEMPANLPERITPAFQADPSISERVKTVHALGTTLSSKEISALYAYLLTPGSPVAATRQNENWLRNEMLNQLAEQETLPSGLADVLLAIYQDPQQDVVMRDYAVQRMTPVYERASSEEKAALRQALWQATGETDGSIAGTALLALQELAQTSEGLERNRVAETALQLATDEQCGELSRITAIQVCGQMGVNQAETLMLQLAQNASSIPLRISAIAALGDLGSNQSETYLRQVAWNADARLQLAAESALQRLHKRRGT